MAGEAITGSTSSASVGSDAGASGTSDSSSHDDTSVDIGDGGGDGSEGSTPSGETAAEKRHRIKWLGREQELTEKELVERFGDDYQHELHGAGGKPLMRDGKPLKATWPELVRYAQMGNGAADSARRYNETIRQHQDRVEWAKAQPENLRTYLRKDMGIENYDRFLLQEAAGAFNKQKQMVELSRTDPVAYASAIRKDIEDQERETREATARFENQNKTKAQQEQAKQQHYGNVQAELKKVNVPLNARTREIADQIMRDYREAGATLTYPELASFVRDQFEGDVFGYLDQHDDETMLKRIGDKRRERLRRAEIAALKAQKKTAAPPSTPRPNNNTVSNEPKGMTAEQFLRSGRRS